LLAWPHEVVTRSPSGFDVIEQEGQPFWLFAAEEHFQMCDYSLQHVASRPAKIEDKLLVTKFNNSITRGFAPVGEPHVAVCLLPGTEIAFEENVEYEPSCAFGRPIWATSRCTTMRLNSRMDR
jgi:hypothetical protein